MATAVSVVDWAIESLSLCLMEKSTPLILHQPVCELLSAELKQMRSFLTNAIEEGGDLEEARRWALAVRDVAYDVGDFVDYISSEILSSRVADGGENWLSYLGLKFKEWKVTYTFAREFASLTARIRDINVAFEGHMVRVAPSQWVEESDFPVKTDLWVTQRETLVGDFFVGMVDEVEKLVSLLVTEQQESNNLLVIGIVGAGGIGKTTLAKKVYQDCRVRPHFEHFAWATVGRDFKPGKVIESLLLQLGEVESREELMPSSDLDLAQKLFKSQVGKKYLIVMDDIWDDGWECLRTAFPSEQTGCTVLLTTRCREAIESVAIKKGIIHQMRCLNQLEALELLQKTAFGVDCLDYKVDRDLQEIGKDIARRCQGLPLAVKVVGALLRAKSTSFEWEILCQNIELYQNLNRKMVHQNVGSYPNNSKGFEDTTNILPILKLSYDALPHHLKQCFLYLSMFPEDHEIDVETLYLLWIAEGLIPYIDGESELTMMDIAEGYLYELAIRSMVLLQEVDVPNSRRFKSCHMHDLLRDLCLLKARDEYFSDALYFEHAKDLGICSHSPFSTPEIPRLALHFKDGCVIPFEWDAGKYPWSMWLKNTCQCEQEFMSLPGFSIQRNLTRLRVLFISGFDSEVVRLPSVTANLIPLQYLSSRAPLPAFPNLKNLRRLKVLRVSGFDFEETSLSWGLEKLSRLEFLSLGNCNITRLPSSICSLSNLVTLHLQDCPEMIIPNELQKLVKLRHLYLPRSFKVHGLEKLRVDALRKLEILVNFDSRVCKAKDLCKLTKLRKLVATIEDNLEDLKTIDSINMNLSYLHISSLFVRKFGHCSREEGFIPFNLFQSPNLHGLHVEGHIEKLPHYISQSLTKISFSSSELEEDPIQKLEKLPNLWALVLQNNAFLGKRMMCSSSGMPRLKCLVLSNLQNLETLTVEAGGMPKLCTLTIRNCKRQLELSERLVFLTTLQQLDLDGWLHYS